MCGEGENLLYFVGLGLKPEHITEEGKKAIKNAKKIYVESYTSVFSEGKIKDLEKELNKKFILLYREDVELHFDKIINEAKKEDVAFCVFGNITSATTHSSAITDAKSSTYTSEALTSVSHSDAKKTKIKFKLIPGISIISVVPMLTGLEEYRFGRTVSIVKPLENYSPSVFFNYIIENKKQGLHTLCLLDIKIEKNKKEYFMQPFEAAERLLEIAKEKKQEMQEIEDWKVISITGACSKKEKIIKTNLKELTKKKTNYNIPSSIVICGKITMPEEEFLKTL